ncbi:unnamed protein product [Acanthoscelides obtectus]|uniref:RNA-directed DNA polymerase n=1 Tax=Acanthoscelides obtectus TaxID=200917 RepID=A0A9P0LPC9_ACAOB|nr:unnamed protein product [Acanthoscelides obtectus]CAK1624271.1 Uncharacterized protein K02A2.6 [Acanthoscelides obtectus]
MALSLSQIKEKSNTDEEIRKVYNLIYSNEFDEKTKPFQAFIPELCFYDNILLRGTRIVIPADLRLAVLQAAHEGHPGIVGMKNRLRTKVWWPKMDTCGEVRKSL